MSAIYPWQREQWRLLKARNDEGRLPHALLLTGMNGMGKQQFATALAQALLCRYRDSEGFACGGCPACERFQAGTHPDFLPVMPEDEGKAITVDMARAVSEFLVLKSHYEGSRIVTLAPAEAMNTAAANCLLKTLEEPAPGTLLILLARTPGALLATIRSRCQQVKFLSPERTEAQKWLRSQLGEQQDVDLLLNLSNGAPLRALRLAEEGLLEQRLEMLEEFVRISAGRSDPVAVAQQWSQQKRVSDAVFWLNSWVMDMIRLKHSSQPPLLVNRDVTERLLKLVKDIGSQRLFVFLERVTKASHYLQGSINAQLLLEDLLITWAALARQRNMKS